MLGTGCRTAAGTKQPAEDKHRGRRVPPHPTPDFYLLSCQPSAPNPPKSSEPVSRINAAYMSRCPCPQSSPQETNKGRKKGEKEALNNRRGAPTPSIISPFPPSPPKPASAANQPCSDLPLRTSSLRSLPLSCRLPSPSPPLSDTSNLLFALTEMWGVRRSPIPAPREREAATQHPTLTNAELKMQFLLALCSYHSGGDPIQSLSDVVSRVQLPPSAAFLQTRL